MKSLRGLLAACLVAPLFALPAFASPESDLAAAAGNGDYALVKALVESGANLNMRDEEGYTALTWAAQHGYADVTTYLVQHGANLNPLDTGGYTPLMWAVQEGHYDVVQVLLAHGANPGAHNWNGRTAMDLASWRGDMRMRDLLNRYTMTAIRAIAHPMAMSGVHSPVVAQMAPAGGAMPSGLPAGGATTTGMGLVGQPGLMGLAGGGRPGQEPDPITKAIALKKLADDALGAGQVMQNYLKAQTSNIGLGSLAALADPDLPLGKSLVDMFANVAKTQSLVGCRQDWQKVNQAWGGRANSKFAKYVTDVDQVLKSANL